MSPRRSTLFTRQLEFEYLTGILGAIKSLVEVVEKHVSIGYKASKKWLALVKFSNRK